MNVSNRGCSINLLWHVAITRSIVASSQVSLLSGQNRKKSKNTFPILSVLLVTFDMMQSSRRLLADSGHFF